MAKGRSGGIKWKGDSLAKYSQHMGKYRDGLLQDLVSDLDRIGRAAEQRGRNRIETSGTITRPEGRVETGRLRDTFTYAVSRRGDEVRLRVGWVDGGPAYTKMQDLGTRDLRDKQGVDPFNKGGVGIPGMFALLDTFVEARDEFKELGL